LHETYKLPACSSRQLIFKVIKTHHAEQTLREIRKMPEHRLASPHGERKQNQRTIQDLLTMIPYFLIFN